uniref:Uncharacterized protein n=1 Tax=Anguilla anguilla TaxID=7936 RepID=A0A0E9S1M6_ANGAN
MTQNRQTDPSSKRGIYKDIL